MKICVRCGQEKELKEFPVYHKMKSGHHNICRSCFTTYEASRREQLRAFVRESKKVCEMCGEDHPAALQFHHRNPEEKEFAISHLISRGWSKSKIQIEIDKCRVLCANCHAKLHWEDSHYTRLA
jgi:protein-arginine kinase activator protein McsA